MHALATPSVKTWLLVVCIVASAPVSLVYALDLGRGGPIQEARVAVNHAWDVYHRAALSGTLASPELQVRIEQDLRAARALLAEIETAEDPTAVDLSNNWINRIHELTDRIVTESQWIKR